MRKATVVVTFALFLIAAFVSLRTACAQEQSKESDGAKTTSAEDSVDACRVDLSLNELEDGKKLNSRHYSIDLTGRQPKEIKIGTRVPVVAGSSNSSSSSSEPSEQYQYLDIGTHVWAQLRGDEVHVSADVSSLDTTAGPETSARLLPVIRQIKIEGSTAVVLGKPIIIGSADDPNSKRQFQLEVTVTKLK
jgi:hypothetical protein